MLILLKSYYILNTNTFDLHNNTKQYYYYHLHLAAIGAEILWS